MVASSDSEAVSQAIGFREVEIVNGRFLVNGKMVKLKGAFRLVP